MEEKFAFNYQKFSNSSELNEEELQLFNAAKKIRKNAYIPYSLFGVGCAILLENGDIVTGNNQENAAYPTGSCAERTAIFWTSANFPNVLIKKLFVVGGSKDLTSIAIPPCGNCRQTILEYEVKQKKPIEIYFASLDGEIFKVNSIRDLLPFSFDANFL